MPPKKRALPLDKFLLIVESPSKCTKIESYLGDSYKCISSKGHIREIDGLSSINVKDRFQIEYSLISEKKDHVAAMKKTVSAYRPECVFLATDDDREGEAIAWHICQVCELDVLSTKRIVFHEITQPAIIAAVANPGRINLSLVAAQQARQVLDLIVGYKISPLLWRYLGGNKKNALSAGRCQTPALRLVADHDTRYKDALSAGVGQIHKISGIFTNRMLPFQLTRTFSVSSEMPILSDFFEKTKTHKHYLSVGQLKPSTRSPPKPFNTSRLLQVASNQLRLSPKTTMSLCQILYQSGLITYMRTDCQKYSEVFLEKSAEFITGEYGADYLGSKEDLVLRDASMPHEAIRATNLLLKHATSTDPMLSKLYGLIWRNTVESCMAASRYNVADITVSAPLDLAYKHSIEIPIFLGWRRVEIKDSTDKCTESQAIESALILYLEQIEKSRSPVSWTLIESKIAMEEKIPAHYTEASLIQKLEDLGIGRPSTFSFIVETIQDRGYVKKTDIAGRRIECVEWKLRNSPLEMETIKTERVFGEEKNKLVIQPTGLLVSEFLSSHFEDCFSYGYTKSLEDELDRLASRPPDDAMSTWHEICRQCFDDIGERSKPLARQNKQTFALADTTEYSLLFNTYGASLKRSLEDGTTEYCKVKPDIELDLEKAKRGEYTMSELIWREDDGILGTYKDAPIHLKKGKYGFYVLWKEKTYSLKGVDKGLADAIKVIAAKENVMSTEDAASMFLPVAKIDGDPDVASSSPLNKSVVRSLRTDLSIRKGKFGNYIYHKTSLMSKPSFYPLNPIKEKWQQMADLELIAWIENTYRISI